ncbi:MAG: hypothetical protein JJ894_07015 [Dinoroseobacter sp.]|nr:hypothetical protein [Dinoroseobacter sp.]
MKVFKGAWVSAEAEHVSFLLGAPHSGLREGCQRDRVDAGSDFGVAGLLLSVAAYWILTKGVKVTASMRATRDIGILQMDQRLRLS